MTRVVGIACGVTIGVSLAAMLARFGLPRAVQFGGTFRATAVCPRCFAPVLRFTGHVCKADDDEQETTGEVSLA